MGSRGSKVDEGVELVENDVTLIRCEELQLDEHKEPVAMMPPSIASCSVVIVTADGVAGTAPCGESLATPLGAAGALGIGLASSFEASFAVAPAGRVGAGDCKPVTEANPPRIFNSVAAAAASISSASIVMKASQQTLPPDAEIANKRSVVGSIA